MAKLKSKITKKFITSRVASVVRLDADTGYGGDPYYDSTFTLFGDRGEVSIMCDTFSDNATKGVNKSIKEAQVLQDQLSLYILHLLDIRVELEKPKPKAKPVKKESK